MKVFFVCLIYWYIWIHKGSSVFSCHLFLISSASVGSITFLSFIEPIFAWNVPLVTLIFLKRYLVVPILLFSIFHWIDHWERLSCLSLLFFGTLHSSGYIYLSSSSLLFISLLFTALHKASSDSQFVFLYFSFLGMVLIPVSCTMSQTSIHSSSGTLFIRYSPLNLFLTSTV